MPDLDLRLVDAVTREVEARRDDAVRLLQELVRVPSTTGEEGVVQEKVEHAFRGRGLEVDVWEAEAGEVEPYRDHVGEQEAYENRPNVAGRRRGRGGGRSLLLNAHVDTVEPGDPTAWGHDPLGGEVVGDRLYGRGSCDMKGGLVTHLAALDALEAAGVELLGDVTVTATVGRRMGGSAPFRPCSEATAPTRPS